MKGVESVPDRHKLARGVRELALQVRGLIARIEHDLDVQPIPRQDLHIAVDELNKVFDKIKIRAALYAIGIAPQNDLLNFPKDAYPGQTVADSISKLVDARKKDIESILDSLENPASDDLTTKAIRRLASPLGQLLLFAEEIMPELTTSVRPLIDELIGLAPGDINENWAAATCYLSSMEVIVNRKLKELKLWKDNERFRLRFVKFVTAARNARVQVSELDNLLKDPFWTLRNAVVHDGYCPTFNEVQEITKWVRRVFEMERGI